MYDLSSVQRGDVLYAVLADLTDVEPVFVLRVASPPVYILVQNVIDGRRWWALGPQLHPCLVDALNHLGGLLEAERRAVDHG